MQTELLGRGVNELEVAYALIQDLNFLRSNYNTRGFDSKSSVFRTFSSSQFNKSTTHPPPERTISRTKTEMIVENLLNKTLPKLVPPLVVVGVKVMGTP